MSVIREMFSDGVILSAAQLQSLSEQPRARAERQNSLVHRWGIASGLKLKAEPSEDAFGNMFARVFVEPGFAIDGYGRELLVTERIELNAERFRLAIGNSIEEETGYPVFAVSEYRPIEGQVGGFSGCGVSAGPAQVEEAVAIRFGQPGDETLEQQAPPLSSAPSPAEGSTDWLIFLGYLTWSAVATKFAGIDEEAAAKLRPAIGINASIVAGNDHVVQLQPKSDLLAGDTVFQVNQTTDGPELCFGTFAGIGQPIDPLLKIDAKGDLVAKGALTGKQTGNSVQLESGIAGDGTILPLPPSVTEKQVEDGDATLHIQVTPHIDASTAPVAGNREFASLIQECRVDEERRVHCRIVWVSLPLGPASEVTGTTISAGPGAVRYIVAAATSEASS